MIRSGEDTNIDKLQEILQVLKDEMKCLKVQTCEKYLSEAGSYTSD